MLEVGAQGADEASGKEPPSKKMRTVDQGGKIRCSHILLKHKDLRMKADPESHQRMKGKGLSTRSLAQAERELLNMQRTVVQSPGSFPKLARQHSECDTAMQPGQNAGDLGWVARGTFGDLTMEAAMFGLKPFEVSDIITTPRGLHIILRFA